MLGNSSKNQPLDKNTHVALAFHQAFAFWKTGLHRFWWSINWLMATLPMLAAVVTPSRFWDWPIFFMIAVVPLPFLTALRAFRAKIHYLRMWLATAVVVNVAGAYYFFLGFFVALFWQKVPFMYLFLVSVAVATINVVVCLWMVIKPKTRGA